MHSAHQHLLIALTLCRIKLLLPPTESAPEGDSFQVIGEKALEAGVLALPGKAFFVLGRATPCTSIPDFDDPSLTLSLTDVRVSFSLLEEHDINEGLRRLAEVVKSCQN